MTKEFYGMMAHIETDWIADAAKKGINSKAALAELRDIARSY